MAKGDNFVRGDGRGHGKLFTATVIDGNWRHAAKMNEVREWTLQIMCSGLWAKPFMRMSSLWLILWLGDRQTQFWENGGRPTKSFFWGRWLFCPWTIKQTQEQSRGSFWVWPMYYHVGSRTVTSRQFVGRRVPRGWKKTAQGLNFNTLVFVSDS